VELDIRTVYISKVPIDVGDTTENFGVAISLGCFSFSLQTEIRFVLPLAELFLFYDALIEVALVHNFLEFARSLNWTVDSKFRRSTIVLKSTVNCIESHTEDISDAINNTGDIDDGDEKFDTLRIIRNIRRESTSRR
jgi:hypothetical protein